MVCEVPGSKPCTRQRDERFCQFVAEGRNYIDAWVKSAPGSKKPTATPGRRVSAHKCAQRNLDRIAFLKRERAKTSPSQLENVTVASLAELMQEVMTTLISAVEAAQRAGEQALATQIRKLINTHAGRSYRLTENTGAVEWETSDVPVENYLHRLPRCECAA